MGGENLEVIGKHGRRIFAGGEGEKRQIKVRPSIIVDCATEGVHNDRWEETQRRLTEIRGYNDLSTAWLIPTRGKVPAIVLQSWFHLLTPVNALVARYFSQGMEVGDAYNAGMEVLLDNPTLDTFKYVLTMEDDNMPPHEGLLKLYENICPCEKLCKEHYSIVSGLYFMKGEGGTPMIYGNPEVTNRLDFSPQLPIKDSIMECNGTGMGFSLMHLGLFRDPDIPKPWFVTKAIEETPTKVAVASQDLYFMRNVRDLGYKIACDTRVKVGHYDSETEIVW